MELNQVPRLGPSKIAKLEAAGITTVRQLAAIDLRKNPDVPGVSREALQKHKADARKLLSDEGKNVPKAPYRGKGQTKRATGKRAQVPVEEAPEPPAPRTRLVLHGDPQPKRQGFFARLVRRE